jgi:O-acetylserine/cysteine efflux transporter
VGDHARSQVREYPVPDTRYLEPTREDLAQGGQRPDLLTAGAALALFLVWSNTFVAISFLLGREGQPARLDWLELTVARFLPVVVVCAAIVAWRWREAVAILRGHPGRLVACGLAAVPCYNLALYWGQAHGVPAPIASLTTTLAPLLMVALAHFTLGESISRRKVVGLLVCLAGIAVVSLARSGEGGKAYPLVVAVTALAPLCWSLFSTWTKPVAGTVPSDLWTWLVILVGSVPLVAIAPWHGGPALLRLDAVGWAAILFLALLATVGGFATWTWLLRRLPASTVGLTVFLNPPLTTLSKVVLAATFPAAFVFSITTLEWIGGAIVLGGLAIALLPGRPRRGSGVTVSTA